MSIIHRIQITVSCADPMQRWHTAALYASSCIAQCFEEGYYQIDIQNHLSDYDLWGLTVGSIYLYYICVVSNT